jgi:hypothetical protein
MIRIPHEAPEEGQIIPALLLVVVALLLFGLLFTQVGSAAEQKTQTQTAADSAAVASTHRVRDIAVITGSRLLPPVYRTVFDGIVPPPPVLQSLACDAAQRNWGANPHGGTSIDCGGSLTVNAAGALVFVALTTPADQVVHGPVDVSADRATARATARVAFARCPFFPSAVRTAVAHFISDATMTSMGAAPGGCFNAADGSVMTALSHTPWLIPAKVGPPQPILTAVRNGLRVELVD